MGLKKKGIDFDLLGHSRSGKRNSKVLERDEKIELSLFSERDPR